VAAAAAAGCARASEDEAANGRDGFRDRDRTGHGLRRATVETPTVEGAAAGATGLGEKRASGWDAGARVVR
jgi:hypothetical protein